VSEENKVIDSTELFFGETEEKAEVPEATEEQENVVEETAPEEQISEETEAQEEKLSVKEKIARARAERKLKNIRQQMDASIYGKNYMSFIRRPARPVFITEDKKDEYRSMHRLGRARIILGCIVVCLLVTAGVVFFVDNMDKEEEIPVSDTSVTAPVVLPRDDFEPVSYDSDTGLAVYDDDFNLFIVNHSNPLPEDYVIETEEYMGVEVDEKIVAALSLMVNDIKEAGMDISFERGYISYEDQLKLFNEEAAKLEKKGSTYLMARHKAGENVDIPGESDYHTGLSVKIKSGKNFVSTKLYKWLSPHGADYGFVFRYPEGKSASTGGEDLTVIRYVGRTNAVRMRQLSMCLEEYEAYLGSR